MLSKPRRFLPVVLSISWAFDWFFWGKIPGISIALFALFLVGGVLLLSAIEKKAPARSSHVLITASLGLFAVSAFRREPMSVFLSIVNGLGLLLILADSYRDGAWTRFTFIDYIRLPFRLALRLLTGAPAHLNEIARQRDPDAAEKAGARPFLPYLRGVLLAVPVLILFAALLSSADLIFADRLGAFLDLFQIENWIDYLVRLIVILLVAYLLLGAYRHAFLGAGAGGRKRLAPARFLGFTESAIVLGSVNLLFAAFVLIQVQYLYGGQVQTVSAGYTFAEYARRGFGELVVVAMFSLVLFLGLSAVTKREGGKQGLAFSWLGVILSVLVGAILISAFQRLLLYESAFGFTRLRTYPHVVMIWIGLLLAVLAALELFGKRRHFALAALAAGFGFVASLGVVNVDGMIAGQNVARARLGDVERAASDPELQAKRIDTAYLMTLSTDAVPALVRAFEDPEIPGWLRDEVGAVLACQAIKVEEESRDLPWQSFHFSRERAASLLAARSGDLAAYPVSQGEFGGWNVTANGEVLSCLGYWVLD